MKNIRVFFIRKFFSFWRWNFIYMLYLNRRVFVMHRRLKLACVSAQPHRSSLSVRGNFASMAIQYAPSEDSDHSDLNLHRAHMSKGTFSDVKVHISHWAKTRTVHMTEEIRASVYLHSLLKIHEINLKGKQSIRPIKQVLNKDVSCNFTCKQTVRKVFDFILSIR